ncbi:MAG: hypothetical protein WAN74_08210 [Thermoplasmata archaeon]
MSAPGLSGSVSFVNWPIAAAGAKKRTTKRPFAHVALEIDLKPSEAELAQPSALRRFEKILKERNVEEGGDLLRLVGSALHAFSAVGFGRVNHWELTPGGWLPLPGDPTGTGVEPLGLLLKALDSEQWKPFSAAREFSVRLSGGGNRADLTVRRTHRERRHSLTVDLYGSVTSADVHALVGKLRERLPVATSDVTRFSYA